MSAEWLQVKESWCGINTFCNFLKRLRARFLFCRIVWDSVARSCLKIYQSGWLIVGKKLPTKLSRGLNKNTKRRNTSGRKRLYWVGIQRSTRDCVGYLQNRVFLVDCTCCVLCIKRKRRSWRGLVAEDERTRAESIESISASELFLTVSHQSLFSFHSHSNLEARATVASKAD